MHSKHAVSDAKVQKRPLTREVRSVLSQISVLAPGQSTLC